MKLKIKIYFIPVFIAIAFIFYVPYQSTLLFPTEIYYVLELLIVFLFAFLAVKYVDFERNKPLYFTIIGIAVIFFSSLMSKINFGQPFQLGAMSERSKLLLVFPFVIFLLLKRKKINVIELLEVVKLLGWFCLVSYTLFYTLSKVGVHFVNSDEFFGDAQNKGLIAKFNGVIIAFMIIYYLNKIYIFPKLKINSLFKISLFIGYLLFIYKKRGIVLFLALTLLFFFLKELSLKQKIIISVLGIVVIGGAYVILQDNLTKAFEIYYSFIDLKDSNGEFKDEVSVGIRLFVELPVALKWLSESWNHLLFGSGNLSNYYNGGFEGHFGYFYPGDLGLIGMIFKYGLISQLLLKLLYLNIRNNFIKSLNVIKGANIKLVMYTFYYFAIFIFLYSLQTGYDMKYLEITFLLYFLFFYINNQDAKTLITK